MFNLGAKSISAWSRVETMFKGAPEYEPTTSALAREDGDHWRSLDLDPQFIFPSPPTGASCLTFILDARPQFVRPQFFFDWGDGFHARDVVDVAEAQVIAVRLELGDWTGLARIRFDPTDGPCEFRFGWIVDAGSLSSSDAAARLIEEARQQGCAASLSDLDLMDYAPAGAGRPFGIRRAPHDSHEHFLRATEIARREFASRIEAAADETSLPLMSFIVPVFDTPTTYLDALLASFRSQRQGLAELVLSDDGSSRESTIAWLARHSRERGVVVHRCASNAGIAAASNEGLRASRGPWVGFVDHDDALAPHAVLALQRAIEDNPDAKLIYTDELIADADLRGVDFFLKPAFDKVLLSGVNYINHLSLYRRDRLLEVGGFRPTFDGSQDYDLLLRFVAGLSDAEVRHLPYPAYIWRRDGASYSVKHLERATLNARRAISDAYSQAPRVVPVEPAIHADLHRPRFDAIIETFPKISIVIPSKNSFSRISRVLDGLLRHTNYPSFEIIIVDNGSTDPQVLALYERLKIQPNLRARVEAAPFNFSRQVNMGIGLSSGELILLLNNDVEIIDPDWLREMASCFQYPGTGIVGARLLYPNGLLQHAGVIVGLGDLAGHWFVGQPADVAGPMARLNVRSSMSAVTGACMLISRACIEEVGMFDDRNFAVAYNDVDFCLRARAAGFRVVYTPFATLLHQESVSRGHDDRGRNRPRFLRDQAELLERHGTEDFVDPAYSPWWGRDRSAPYMIALDALPRAR